MGPGCWVTCVENHWLDTAPGSHKLVTRPSGKIAGLIAPRDPPRNGTHTTSTRSAGSAIRLKMLLCTQLAPARHVAQVGEKINTRRVSPSSLLNTDFKVEMSFSDMTLPLRDAAPGLAAGAADVHDARTTAAAITAAIQASRDLRPRRRATGIPTLFPSPRT